MLPEVFATQLKRRDFLNISTGERIRVDLPGLRYQFVFGHTFDGLILLCQKVNGAVRLLNPLTRQLTDLPNAALLLSSLKNQDNTWISSTGLRELKKLQPFSVGLTDSSTLALHFAYHELAVAKPNVKRKGIMVADITSAGPQLVMAAKVDKSYFGAYQHWNLVDNGGEMILVRRRYGANFPRKYEVYLVDLEAGKIVPMVGLRGRALFVCHSVIGTYWYSGLSGGGCGLSVHAGLSSSISADMVYVCRETGKRAHCQLKIDAYDLWREDWIKQDVCAR
ncbi:hypothetical protein ACQ4PT_001166 [Festuca glaucescens]